MYSNLILICIALLLLGTNIHQVRGERKSHSIIDAKPSKGLSVLKFLCDQSKGHEKQISRLSTITWLNDHLKSSSSSSPKSDKVAQKQQIICHDRYREMVESLNNVITVSNDNICSDQKVSLMENFHMKYIADTITRKHKPGHGIDHEPLKLFFMHYASEVTVVCRWHLINNLKLLDQKEEHNYESLIRGGSFGRLIDAMHKYLGSPSSMKDFDDFVLIWNMLKEYNRKKDKSSSVAGESSPFSDSINERGGVELRVKVKSIGDISIIQDKCSNKLKPIYSKITLPLMRFIDLGYYRNAASSLKDLNPKQRDQVKNWYGITQACEAILAIKIYQDESLKPDEVVLITREEANQLEAKLRKIKSKSRKDNDNMKKKVKFSVKKHTFGGDDSLRSVHVEKAKKMVKIIRTNLKTRNRTFKKILRKLASDLRGKLKNKMKKFFVSKKTDNSIGVGNKFVKENAEPLISSSLERAQKFIQDQSDGLESLNRRKRCVTIAIVVAIVAIIAIIVLIVLIILIIFLIG